MTVVATLSGVLAAVLPVLVGLALGDHLAALTAIGIVTAVPAIGLVSWQPGGDRRDLRASVAYGSLAGLGFALLFVALDRAGTRAGGLADAARPGRRPVHRGPRSRCGGGRRAGAPRLRDAALVVAAGLLACAAALLFLAASGRGELAIVAVLASMYPAFTIVLARALLGERWSRLQVAGLLVAVVSVVLVSLG